MKSRMTANRKVMRRTSVDRSFSDTRKGSEYGEDRSRIAQCRDSMNRQADNSTAHQPIKPLSIGELNKLFDLF
jgi:hypothetical protein